VRSQRMTKCEPWFTIELIVLDELLVLKGKGEEHLQLLEHWHTLFEMTSLCILERSFPSLARNDVLSKLDHAVGLDLISDKHSSSVLEHQEN
jgi:hypothetical protein